MHTFKPSRATADHSDNEMLPAAPNNPFRLCVHPENWELAGDDWLPRVKWWKLQPGVNGVRNFSATGHMLGQVTMEGAHGFQVLDPVKTPILSRDEDGKLVESRGYLDRYDALKGGMKGTYHATPWDVFNGIKGRGRNAVAIFEWDQEAFDATRKMWLERGIIDKPHSQTLEAVIDMQRRRADRRVSEAHDGAPHVQKKVEREHERLARMEAAAAISAENGAIGGNRRVRKPAKGKRA